MQAVEASRTWPTNVPEFSEMLQASGPLAIAFTVAADADVVKYNFFKMCYSLHSDDEPDSPFRQQLASLKPGEREGEPEPLVVTAYREADRQRHSQPHNTTPDAVSFGS